MPPRKKATADTTSAADPPRRSSRAKPASTAGAATAADSKPTSKARPSSKAKPESKASTSKAGKKRARDEDEDEAQGDDDDTAKPVSKKAKTEEEKMVKVLKRGSAPVDPVSSYVASHQVLESDGEIWDAMLNQTDIANNANKFYVMQLLHPLSDNSSCILFTRWGRVGEDGQKQTKGPWASNIAINEFKKQFKSKTSTNWEARHNMVAKKGKYTWLERSFENEEPEEEQEAGPSDTKPKSVVIPDSKLPSEIQTVCNLIFNQSIVNAALSEMNYDANKLPLGKLSKKTILNGFSALKQLAETINNPDGDVAKQYGSFQHACEELTSSYYSIIPHIFSRNQRPIVISSETLLKRELDLVDALGDMQIAQNLIESTTPKDADGNPINPLDARFKSLELSSILPVDPSSKEFAALNAYAVESHGKTHHFTINIQHAFRVGRESESEAWSKAGHDSLADGQRLLLWHGSRSTNFAGILRQGLRIAPPEAPVTGYMFGKGVYFADIVSKSAGYCHTHLSNGLGLLLLCEVAAKPTFEQIHANYDAAAQCKAAGKMTTHGLGRWQPTEWQDAGAALDNDDLNGCHMPKGAAQEVGNNAGLWYNEYIAYDTSQIKLRYMLLFKN